MKKEIILNLIGILILIGGYAIYRKASDERMNRIIKEYKISAQPAKKSPPKKHLEKPQRVYSIAEITTLLKDSPDKWKGQSFWIKGQVVDALFGMGCNNYAVLTDPQFAELYKKSAGGNLSDEEKKEISDIPILKTGDLLGYQKSIYPSVQAIFTGHFGDAHTQKCPSGEQRFSIQTMQKDLTVTETPP